MKKVDIDFKVCGNVKICTLDNEMAIALFKQRIHEALIEFDCDKLSIDINVNNIDIMDTSNGHNPSLVNAINNAYNKRTEEFEEILRMLVKRDIDDIDPEHIDVSTASLDNLAHYYCQCIADDWDLEAILRFCRIGF